MSTCWPLARQAVAKHTRCLAPQAVCVRHKSSFLTTAFFFEPRWQPFMLCGANTPRHRRPSLPRSQRSGAPTLPPRPASWLANQEGGQYASLTGSMVELHFDMLEDLLHNHAACSIGPAPEYRIRGAQEVTLRDDSDVFKLASAVEERTVRGTRMNDTSSRSHCVTTLKLSMLDTGAGTVRTSRFQFFDMMGSERSKGATSAHDPTQNNKKKLAGMEGIVANMSLSQLSQITSVLITSQRRARKGAIATPPTLRGFPPNLMQMLAGSLGGSAATAMICTLSQIPINGNETWHSLSYAKELSPLLALPKRQKAVNVGKAVAELIKLGGDTWTGVVPAAAATNKYVKMRALNAQDAARDLAVLRDLARGAEYELPATASGGGGKKSKGSSRRSRARCK